MQSSFLPPIEPPAFFLAAGTDVGLLQQMFDLFHKGGPIMWPMLLCSILGVTVVTERLIFYWRHAKRRRPEDVRRILKLAEQDDFDGAIRLGKGSVDYVANVLAEGLENRDASLTEALARAAAEELNSMNQGLPIMDTCVTAAPLIGLLGTVTGMMKSFFALGDEIESAAALTGGIAEALIATASALAVAVICVVPYNYCYSRVEQARHDIEDACYRLELIMLRKERRS
jgi:biopolymer transport protein ExbB